MEDIRSSNQQLYRELQHDRCPQYKPKKHLKDADKNNLKVLSIGIGDWEQMPVNQSAWRKMISKVCKVFETWRIKLSSLKQALWQHVLVLVPETLYSEHICYIRNRVCISKASLLDNKRLKTHFTKVFQQQLLGNFCQFCHKLCGSTACLKGHIRVHRVNFDFKKIQQIHLSDMHRACKNILGLMSQTCPQGYS